MEQRQDDINSGYITVIGSSVPGTEQASLVSGYDYIEFIPSNAENQSTDIETYSHVENEDLDTDQPEVGSIDTNSATENNELS